MRCAATADNNALIQGERYNRYTDERMLVIDRIVGNQLEWAPMFLSLFWLATTAVQVRAGAAPTPGSLTQAARRIRQRRGSRLWGL